MLCCPREEEQATVLLTVTRGQNVLKLDFSSDCAGNRVNGPMGLSLTALLDLLPRPTNP